MRIEYKHNHTKEDVHQKIDGFLGELSKKYGDMIQYPTKNWNSSKDRMDFSFRARGFNIMGDVQLYAGKLVLEGRLPLLAIAFEGKATSIIKEKLEEILC